jgi:ubiquinone/menaquinone biosynthesis C-methylase UbiE
MVEVARTRSKEHRNIEYFVADAASWEFPLERFDCVASITTLHHLPLGPMLAKLRDVLKPGGTLLLLDLYRAHHCGPRCGRPGGASEQGYQAGENWLLFRATIA